MRNILIYAFTLVLCQGSSYGEEKTFGFDYNLNFLNDDHGIEKTDDHKPTATTEIGGNAFLSFSGSKGPTTFNVYLNILACEGETACTLDRGLEQALASHKISDLLTVSAGRTYVREGGYDTATWVYDTAFVSPYTSGSLPLNGVDELLEIGLNFNTGGEVSIQFLEDVVGDGSDGGYFNTAKKQPAWLVEWTSTFGALAPLVQIVPYDTGRSLHLSVGTSYNEGPIEGYFTYVMDNRQKKSGDKSETDNHTNIVLEGRYHMATLSPFVKFASYDVKQGGTDLKGNSDGNSFDDNGTIVGVGAVMTNHGESFRPHLIFMQKSAKVGADGTARSSTMIQVGVTGSI